MSQDAAVHGGAGISSAQKPWLSAYPEGVPAEIDLSAYDSLVGLMEESFRLYGDRAACMTQARGD